MTAQISPRTEEEPPPGRRRPARRAPSRQGALAAVVGAGFLAGGTLSALGPLSQAPAPAAVSGARTGASPKTAHGHDAEAGTSADDRPAMEERARERAVDGKRPAPGPPGAVSASRSWTRPVPRARVSQPYGVPGNWKAGHHTGIDFAVGVGTPVRSVGPGRVVFAGRSGDYGKAVTIRMTDGKYTLYAHLSRVLVRRGQSVRAGSFIARSGNTGRSTGPHLHFEVRTRRGYGSDIDPVAYMRRKGVRLV